MRKFISSFGGFSVKAFTNRDIVGLRIWLTPPLPDPPYRHLAPRSFASSGNGRCNALCLIPRRVHPHVAFFRRRQDHWHCLWVDRLNDRVRRRGQEAVDQVRAGERLRLGATIAFEFGPDTGERKRRAIIIEREPDDIPLLVSGFGSGAYSAKLLNGTRQRFSGFSRRSSG
jgi:hypothetical protein